MAIRFFINIVMLKYGFLDFSTNSWSLCCKELHKSAAPYQSTVEQAVLAILGVQSPVASIDLSNIIMSACMSSDKVSLVNFSESTPNSVHGLRSSCSANEAANVLIISSDLRVLSSYICLHFSSFCLHSYSYLLLFSSQQNFSFCHSVSCLWDSSSQSSMN